MRSGVIWDSQSFCLGTSRNCYKSVCRSLEVQQLPWSQGLLWALGIPSSAIDPWNRRWQILRVTFHSFLFFQWGKQNSSVYSGNSGHLGGESMPAGPISRVCVCVCVCLLPFSPHSHFWIVNRILKLGTLYCESHSTTCTLFFFHLQNRATNTKFSKLVKYCILPNSYGSECWWK